MAINIYTDPDALKADTEAELEYYACTVCDWEGSGQDYTDALYYVKPVRSEKGFPVYGCPNCGHDVRQVR